MINTILQTVRYYYTGIRILCLTHLLSLTNKTVYKHFYYITNSDFAVTSSKREIQEVICRIKLEEIKQHKRSRRRLHSMTMSTPCSDVMIFLHVAASLKTSISKNWSKLRNSNLTKPTHVLKSLVIEIQRYKVVIFPFFSYILYCIC